MIKYYGGKKWLSKKIKYYLPKDSSINVAIDLFVGGGSIAEVLVDNYSSVFINDIDYNLITFYNECKNNPEQFIQYITSKIENLSFDEIKTYRYKLNNNEQPNIEIAYLYYCCVYSSYGGKVYQAPTRANFNVLKNKNIRYNKYERKECDENEKYNANENNKYKK